MKNKKHNIFISHYFKDDDKVQSLKQRLIDSSYDVRNYSVDSTKHKDGRTPSKEVIKRYLEARIAASSTFICVISDKTHTRPWVDFEIRQAIEQGKKIIGIYNHGDKDKVEIPKALKEIDADIIGWNSVDKIGELIEDKNDNNDVSAGFNYTIQRVKC